MTDILTEAIILNNHLDGLILKGIGGFYYVETSEGIYECSVRGIFRKKDKLSPVPGDKVVIEIENDIKKGSICKILPRKNHLVRPSIANIDQLFVVISTISPNPNFLVIDKIIALSEYKNIEPIIIITKRDLHDNSKIEEIYNNAGFQVYNICKNDLSQIDNIFTSLSGKISALTGNSGVGKSTLLNRIFPKLDLSTDEISTKLGRGKHTTRQVELFKHECGGYFADTPGFSAVDFERYEIIQKDELQYCFREIKQYIGDCKFVGCSHTCEKGCSVIQAYNEDKISLSRFESYKAMYEEAKTIKEWEHR